MTISTTHTDLLISTESLAGELASQAIQQSPYDMPAGLVEAILDFRAAWPHSADYMPAMKMLKWRSYSDLKTALERIFQDTPSIRKWNDRKNGRDGIGFSSRYEQPEPDDDFIDLGALANNVAREVWKDACDFHDFNADFDRRHGTEMAGPEQ